MMSDMTEINPNALLGCVVERVSERGGKLVLHFRGYKAIEISDSFVKACDIEAARMRANVEREEREALARLKAKYEIHE